MIGGILLLLLFIVYGGFLHLGGGGNTEPAYREIETPLPAVRTSFAEERDMSQRLTYHGRLAPYSQIGVTPKIPGIVKEVFCKVGDNLSPKDPILQLETEELLLQVRQAEAALQVAQANEARVLAGARAEEIQQAEAGLKQAEANYNQARLNYNRSQKLYEEGVISGRDWEGIQVQYEGARTQLINAEKTLVMIQQGAREEDILSAQASVAQAQVALDLAKLNLRNATITAPIYGTVNRILAEKGSMAGAGMAVASMVNIDTVKLPLTVSGRDVVRLQEGQQVNIAVDALPHQSFQGIVKTISLAAEEGSGLFAITVNIENPGRILRPGMYATATIMVQEKTHTTGLPQSAIFHQEEKDFVFLVEEDILQKVPVETGIEKDGYVEIITGIVPGDQVVLQGQEALEDGLKVEITHWSEWD